MAPLLILNLMVQVAAAGMPVTADLLKPMQTTRLPAANTLAPREVLTA